MITLLGNSSTAPVMFPSFQDSTSVLPEYSELMSEYCKMLTYSAQVSQILVLMRTLEKGSTQVVSLYTQAVAAHLAAINAYKRMVAIYEQLFQKYWNNAHGA